MEDTEICTAILYESLRASAPGDNGTEPHLIPSTNWKFHSAAISGQFIQFYKTQDFAAAYVDVIENDALIAKKKDFIKYRLNWIATQHPDMAPSTPLSNGEDSGSDESGAMTSKEYLVSIFLGSAFGFGVGWHILC